MRTAFALCVDCREITTGRLDSSKGFLLDAASNHDRCTIRVFGDVPNLPPPIRDSITRLGASVPTSDNQILMFRLGLQLEGWLPEESACPPAPSTAPAAASTSPTLPAPAPQPAVSTNSRPVSTPTSTIAASQPETLLDLLSEAP